METISSHSNPAIVLLFCQHLPKMCVCAQSCLILCDPQDYSAPGSSLCSWTSPGKNTGVGCHFLLLGVFLTQGLNLGLLHCYIHPLFPGGSDGKASAYNEGDRGSILGSGRPSGEGNGHPLQYSCLGNPMDRGSCTVHRVAKSRTQLSD